MPRYPPGASGSVCLFSQTVLARIYLAFCEDIIAIRLGVGKPSTEMNVAEVCEFWEENVYFGDYHSKYLFILKNKQLFKILSFFVKCNNKEAIS